MRRRPPLHDVVRVRIAELVESAARAHVIGDQATAWRQLEDAHVLSQPWVRPHLRVHAHMLGFALRQRDIREIAGQVGRLLLAGPGSVTGRYPIGNTGRSRVSAFAAMPIRDDLADLLSTAPSAPPSDETGPANS
ncbi:MAG: DUF3703 domain-containing protein [Ilumatobacter sp.]